MAWPDLSSCRVKLDGAERKIAELEKPIWKTAAVAHLLEIGTERENDGRVRVFVEELGEMPEEWLLWIGECVHDLRSALDHISYALNVLGYGSEPLPKPRWPQFPIFDNATDYGGKSPNMVKWVPPKAVAAIEALQPYHRGNDPELRRLWELSELSNIDKHRRFPVAGLTISFLSFPRTVEGFAVVESEPGPHELLKPNATIMWLKVPSVPVNVEKPKVEFPYGCTVNFDGRSTEAPLPIGMPHFDAVFILGSILGFIRDRVVPEFEKFFV